MPQIRPLLVLLRQQWIAALVMGLVLLPVHAQTPPVEPRQTWQMLDYIAVDYAAAVHGGRILSPGEYAEMQEFASAVRTQLQTLPASPQQPRLLARADQLVAAVDLKADSTQVASLVRVMADDLLADYPIGAVPVSPPEPARVTALYAQQCAACHGPTGRGDGLAGATLDPPPIAFTDAGRAAQRTPLALYEVISQGVPGTSMPGFAALSEADRWALAFYTGSLAYSARARTDGETVWRARADLRGRIPTLEALTRTREAELAATVSPAEAHAIVAYLRSRPEAVNQSPGRSHPFSLARQRMAASERAYAAGDTAQATTSALSAYLDGVEPVEAALGTRDPSLMREIETAMARYRSQLARPGALADVSAQSAEVNALLDRAEAVLTDTRMDTTTAFLGSFTILVREGLEALLIVMGMIVFLRKAERADILPYVHAGWASALLAGAATWAAATYLIDISGANRELTEGLSALFAAAVLLSVGIWMHQKSLAGRWQQYLQAKLSKALTRRSALFLFVLAFIVVYREVFETILFFIAMWSEAVSGAILAGFAAGCLVLAAVAYWMVRASARLPVGRFFSISSLLIAVLAVVLAGKGVAALQEAGWVTQAGVTGPRIEWLGVYPSWESLLVQLGVATLAIIGFITNTRSLKASAASSSRS